MASRFGHLNYRSLEILAKWKGVLGLPILHNVSQCEECAMCKQERGPFPTIRSRRSSSCLQLIHMDICGPMSVSSLGGNKYFLLLIDDYSRKC